MNKKANNQQINKKAKVKKEKTEKLNMFAFGHLDLTFIIEFYDNDLIDKEGKKIKLEDIDEMDKLEFIKDNQKLINRIKIESENDFIKQFLLLKEISKGKRQIEFFPFCTPQFNGRSLFFEKIFDEVINKYDILINKRSLDKKQGYSLKLKLTHKNQCNEFEYCSVDKETDNEIMEESCNKKENNENDNNEGEETEAMKKGLIPYFKNKECIFRKLNPSCQKYDLMYINYNDLKNIDGGFEEEDFIELVNFFKKKKTKIFINYYTSSKSQIADPPEGDDDNEEENNDDEENNEDNNENKTEENNENNEEKPKNSKKFSNQKKLNLLYKITDIFFFDEKQAYELFDRHLKCFGEKNTSNNLNKTKIYDYFISSIAGNNTDSNDSKEKIGLFLKDMENFIIIECSNNTGTKDILDCKLYPKKTIRNIELINKYKSIIQENKDEYYNIFATFMLDALFNNNNNVVEEINISFKNALNIIKKEIECNKNNVKFNMATLVNYQTIKSNNMENRKNYAQKGKENGFILDCMNREKSKLKEYLPLKDKNLKWFIRSRSNMKYLVNRGFIDKEGYIIYDKEYRQYFGSPTNIRKKTIEKNRYNLSKYILASSINNNLNLDYFRTKEKIPK